MMKNTFFTLKALLVHKIINYLPWLFPHVEKRLDKKNQVISKFMTSQPG